MKSRSIFWPLVLVATGLLWLLVNLGTVPSANLWALYYFVPWFILILGLGLVLRAFWQPAGMLISTLVVALAVLAVLFAPIPGWNKAPEWGCFGHPVFGRMAAIGHWRMVLPIPGSGVIASDERTLPEFTAVVVDFPGEVVIRQGTTQSVKVTADDNLLPQLDTRVSSGVLYIERGDVPHDERVSPTETVQIELTVRDLDHLDFGAAGSITIENLQTETLSVSLGGVGEIRMLNLELGNMDVDLSGAGSIEASGAAEDLHLDLSGLGSFEAENLAVQTADAGISGMGSATLWVEQQLKAAISGTGSLNYYGNPHVDQSISGVGSVQKQGDK